VTEYKAIEKVLVHALLITSGKNTLVLLDFEYGTYFNDHNTFIGVPLESKKQTKPLKVLINAVGFEVMR
jgi:hypothetical protein